MTAMEITSVLLRMLVDVVTLRTLDHDSVCLRTGFAPSPFAVPDLPRNSTAQFPDLERAQDAVVVSGDFLTIAEHFLL